MPRMPGFLQSRSKKEEAEWDRVQSRTAARLAAMFREETGQEPSAEADLSSVPPLDGVDVAGQAPTLESAPRARRADGRRPRIIVLGNPDGGTVKPTRPRARRVVEHGPGPNGWTVVDPSARDDLAEPVAVMATPAEGHPAEDIWRLPVEPAADLAMAPEAPAEVAESAAAPGVPASVDALLSPDVPPSADVPPGAEALPSPAASQRAPRPAALRTPAKRKSRASSRVVAAVPVPPPAPTAHCPYCALLLDPAPTVSKRCDRCRQRIVVKRADGRMVYLTEAAVLVFDAERRRVANAGRLTRERERWLRLAAPAGAPASRVTQLGAARLTEEVVSAARTLYLTTVDRAVRAAKHDRDWDAAARIRREQAMTLYRLAGSRVPPPAEVLAVYREGVAAELRGVAEISRDAELVSARCCDACRADDGRIFRIATELRVPRLPHAACPKGLCHCQWDLAARDRRTIRRYLQRRPGTAVRAVSPEAASTIPPEDMPTASAEAAPVD